MYSAPHPEVTTKKGLGLGSVGDSFGEGHATINALLESESDLAVCGVKFVEHLNAHAEPVGDNVVREIGKHNRTHASCNGGVAIGNLERATKKAVGLLGLKTGLPNVLAVGILKLANENCH